LPQLAEETVFVFQICRLSTGRGPISDYLSIASSEQWIGGFLHPITTPYFGLTR